jgi:hypothetical protein
MKLASPDKIRSLTNLLKGREYEASRINLGSAYEKYETSLAAPDKRPDKLIKGSEI